jgi:hypothetical protein
MGSSEVILPTTPVCDGCGPPRDFLYIHGEAEFIVFCIKNPVTGAGYVAGVTLYRGVYTIWFESLQEEGFEVTMHSEDESDKMLKFFRICCGSRVIFEVESGTSYDEIMQIATDVEDEETFYSPTYVTFELDDYGALDIGLHPGVALDDDDFPFPEE